MVRGLFRFIALLVFFAVIRYVIVTVARFFSQAMKSDATPSGAATEGAPIRGELKKDPVCGTFIAVATSLHKTVGGEMYYFCSADCRDKFKI